MGVRKGKGSCVVEKEEGGFYCGVWSDEHSGDDIVRVGMKASFRAALIVHKLYFEAVSRRYLCADVDCNGKE